MASIKLRRGSGVPSGLTFGEPAFDITNSRFYVGITGGSALIGVAGGGVHSFNGLTGAVTGVTTGTANTFGPLQSFTNGISSAGGTFTALTTFTSGLSASGATFTGDVNFSALNGRIIANNQLDITGKGIYLQGISTGVFVRPSTITLPNDGTSLLISCGNGTLEFFNSDADSTIRTTTLSFNTFQSLGLNEYYSKFRIGPSTDPGTNLSYNAYLPADTGTIALTKNVVSSFNGFTGAVTGVTTGTANIFGPLQSFTNGISAAGGVTFNSTIISNGYRYSSSIFDSRTSGFTLSAADAGKTFLIGACAAATIIYCPTGLPVGFQCDVIRRAEAGQRIRIFESGTTIESKTGTNPELPNSSNGGEKATIMQIQTNVYVVSGDI